MMPSRIREAPRARINRKPKSGACTIQWEIHHGTSPAPIPAARRRKSADPKAAGILPAGGTTEVTLGHRRTANYPRLLLRPKTFKGRAAQSVLLALAIFQHTDRLA